MKRPSRPPEAHVDQRRRTFTDSDGRRWRVREVPNPSYDRRGGTCLIFESTDTLRRVRTFPPEWYDMSDAALLELSNTV
ncbi:MAG: hypothetical protein ACHQWU_06790 [Gemmatimonadales bacterium]